MVFKTNYRLMKVESIAECSKGSILQYFRPPLSSKRGILQYFRPSLSYHLSLRSSFCLLLSGRLRQVLLYKKKPLLNAHTDKTSGASSLNFGWSLYLHSYFMYARSNGVARMLKKVAHIKRRLLDHAVIQFDCVPFHNGNFSLRKE